jgi:nitrite reductase (NADH) small subunit
MTWLRITEIENIPLREGRSVTLGDREIAIFNLGTGFVAMENRCPHKGGPLADGIVSATGETLTVTCPLHNWRVALESGQVVRPAGEDGICVRTFPVKVENGIIEVCVGDAGFSGPRCRGIAQEAAA